jgi:hypothetical protein
MLVTAMINHLHCLVEAEKWKYSLFDIHFSALHVAWTRLGAVSSARTCNKWQFLIFFLR